MKEFLFTIHMFGKARAEDISELSDLVRSIIISFDRENISVDTMKLETNSVADIDGEGNVGQHRYRTPALPVSD